MWCARWNEERVSWLYSPVNKEIFQSLSFDGCQKIFRFNLRHESNEHMRSWPGGNGMPHFCLAAPARGLFVAGGVGIVGMDLDGQFIGGKNEFDKNRELRRRR